MKLELMIWVSNIVPSRKTDTTIKVMIYGPEPKLERPKILMINNKPAYLYGPSDWNIYGGQRTVGHVLKINLDQ